MSKIRPRCFDADYADRLPRADVFLREGPDEEDDDEEEEEGNVTDDDDDDDMQDEEGYSVRLCPLWEW